VFRVPGQLERLGLWTKSDMYLAMVTQSVCCSHIHICVAVCCSVLQCGAVWCGVLKFGPS